MYNLKDRVKVVFPKYYQTESIEGIIDRYWGHADDTGGIVIIDDNGHEYWLESQEIFEGVKIERI